LDTETGYIITDTRKYEQFNDIDQLGEIVEFQLKNTPLDQRKIRIMVNDNNRFKMCQEITLKEEEEIN